MSTTDTVAELDKPASRKGGAVSKADPIVELDKVTLSFKHFYHRSGGLAHCLGLLAHMVRGQALSRFVVLKDFDLTIWHGETVGVIGPNGAGKTTMLRLIAGIYSPDSGYIHVEGRIGSLLALGSGFNNYFAAPDNIRLAALLMGVKSSEIDRTVDEVIKFAELEDFRDMPLKYYSAGMYSRLAFSLTLFMEPDVLLIDEVLGVGDIRFQSKAKSAMEMLRAKAHTQLIVTHDLNMVQENCTRAVCIADTRKLFDGTPHEVVKEYIAMFGGGAG
jgi:ABC-type polysaccharide/polyol phosphate transport system ATPase subunit